MQSAVRLLGIKRPAATKPTRFQTREIMHDSLARNPTRLGHKNRTKKITGVLLWDLSAAFDTLDCDGLCAKLELYRLQPRSVRWIKSFLNDRSQCVRIGNQISSPRLVPMGVPQGGVLSPLVFVLFVSDLQD